MSQEKAELVDSGITERTWTNTIIIYINWIFAKNITMNIISSGISSMFNIYHILLLSLLLIQHPFSDIVIRQHIISFDDSVIPYDLPVSPHFQHPSDLYIHPILLEC